MHYELISESFPRARVVHICIWCGDPIEKGEEYRHEISKYDGEFQNHKWHLECNYAAQREFDQPWSECEFEPYCNERPGKVVQS